MIELWLRRHWKTLLILLGFAALAVLYWMPLSLHMRTRFFDPNFGDSAFNMWIVGWGNHALTHAPWNFFEAPMFHPYPHVLAWGDHLFSVTLVTLPLVPILGLLTTYNLILVGSSALCGFTLYLLVKYLTRNTAAAILAGSMWLLSYTRVVQAYIQILPLWWLPLIFLLAEKIRRGEWKRRIWWLSLVIFMQLTVGIYVAMYTAIAFGIYVAVLGLFRQIKKSVMVDYIKAWLVAGILALPVYLPSLILNFSRPTVRGLNEQASLKLVDLNPLHAPGVLWHSLLMKLGMQPDLRVAQYSLGVLLSLVVIVALGYGMWRVIQAKRIDPKKALPIAFLAIGVFSFLASLGPYVTIGNHQIKNIFFLVPYILIPGFKVMRLTLRWQFIALFGLAVFASFPIAYVLRKQSRKVVASSICLAILFLIIEQVNWNRAGISKAPTLQSAPAYEWLSKQSGDFAIAELPIYPGVYYSKNDVMEGRRLYFQTLSGFHPRVSGAYSPFTPQGYAGRAGSLNGIGDDPKALRTARELKLKYIVFLPEDYTTLGWGEQTAKNKEQQLDNAPYLKRVFQSHKGSIYQINY